MADRSAFEAWAVRWEMFHGRFGGKLQDYLAHPPIAEEIGHETIVRKLGRSGLVVPEKLLIAALSRTAILQSKTTPYVYGDSFSAASVSAFASYPYNHG